ncbi:diguanylate cyclase [Klebsiella oxytoca]|uniref:diguanylate cyclase n=1 Tax=Klebsiella oxytoca TaxID=571 RepID=UPI000665F68C|nr:diguanylate cyclase [Klebsiella oxytoca]
MKASSSVDFDSIDSRIMELTIATESHFRWLVHIIACIVRDEFISVDILNKESYKYCSFGRWLKSVFTPEHEDYKYLQYINDSHVKLHKQCITLLFMINQEEKIEKLLLDFENSLLDFTGSINKYKEYLLKLRTSYDFLTGLPSRKLLDEYFALSRYKKNNEITYLLLLDIDHFKAINDSYGHLVGDLVLKHFAAHLRTIIRNSDMAFRYGGEEFIILLNISSDKEACYAAERIRKKIVDLDFNFKNALIKVTFTSGLVKVLPMETMEDSIKKADHALYKGKSSGRNCTMFFSDNGRVKKLI